MTIAIIVQARMSSTRLPGKVLLPLAGRPVLQHVLLRCKAIPLADVVVCAIPALADCEPLAVVAEAAGARVFRGSEQDVLSRYAGAARSVGADVVMRVTSDCPLIDAGVCQNVIARLLEAGADYACNNNPPGWPHGLDCEAMTARVLMLAETEANAPFDREHVTPWIRRQPQLRQMSLAGPGTHTHYRWTLDHPADYAFFRAVFDALGPEATTADVIAFLVRHPEVAAVNAAYDRPPNQAPA